MCSGSQKANHFLGGIKHSIAGQSRQAAVPVYTALMKPHHKCCCAIWGTSNKDISPLEYNQRRVTKMVKGLKGKKTYEKQLK